MKKPTDLSVHTTQRSATYGVNVITRSRNGEPFMSHINIFINGVPERSMEIDGLVDIGSALIAVGTQLKLENK